MAQLRAPLPSLTRSRSTAAACLRILRVQIRQRMQHLVESRAPCERERCPVSVCIKNLLASDSCLYLNICQRLLQHSPLLLASRRRKVARPLDFRCGVRQRPARGGLLGATCSYTSPNLGPWPAPRTQNLAPPHGPSRTEARFQHLFQSPTTNLPAP